MTSATRWAEVGPKVLVGHKGPLDSAQLAHESEVQRTTLKLIIQGIRDESGPHWTLMGQDPNTSLFQRLSQRSLETTPEQAWVRTCSLSFTAVQQVQPSPRSRPPVARRNANGTQRRRRTVKVSGLALLDRARRGTTSRGWRAHRSMRLGRPKARSWPCAGVRWP
jgi:hypothetical protein